MKLSLENLQDYIIRAAADYASQRDVIKYLIEKLYIEDCCDSDTYEDIATSLMQDIMKICKGEQCED